MFLIQIVKYKWENWEPFLFFRNEKFGRIRLFDQNISMRLGKRHCIGFFKDGKHHPCPNEKEITHGWYCDQCKKNDDFFLCIKCSGEKCINEKRREECKKNNYYIYLAAFDSLLKVGISYEYRLLERLIEQGADFGAKIAFIQDGKAVRRIEQDIKNCLHAVDRVSGEEKHATLFGNPNNSASIIYEAINKLRGNFDLINLEIYDLRRYYRLQNILLKPKKIQIRDNLEIVGNVVAAKGNMLIIKSGYDFYSLNAHDLIGRKVEEIK